jgi:hypothetical protein
MKRSARKKVWTMKGMEEYVLLNHISFYDDLPYR